MHDCPMNSETPRPVAPAAHAIMFWWLTFLAMAVFAPCVLVPIWGKTEDIIEHERSAAALVADLQAQADRNEAQIRALLGDPLVNQRIVRRELNYRPEGEEVVHWPAAELTPLDIVLPEPPLAADLERPNHRPAWVTSLIRWLPPWPWRGLFAESPSRPVMLMMAGGLLATAFLLYGSPSTRSTRVTAKR